MAAVLEESQAAGVADVGRAIDDSCPYSSRSGFAYKSWLEARRDFFRKHNIPLLILIVNGTRNCAQQEVKMSEQVKRYSFGEFAEKHTHPVGPGSYVKASDYDALHAEAVALRVALAGMLFAFDDGVGQEWSKPLLDYARTLTPAQEYKP